MKVATSKDVDATALLSQVNVTQGNSGGVESVYYDKSKYSAALLQYIDDAKKNLAYFTFQREDMLK